MNYLQKRTFSSLLYFLSHQRLTQDQYISLNITNGSIQSDLLSSSLCLHKTGCMPAAWMTSSLSEVIAGSAGLQGHKNAQLSYRNHLRPILLKVAESFPNFQPSTSVVRHHHTRCSGQRIALSFRNAASFHGTGQSGSMDSDNKLISGLAQLILDKTSEVDVMAGSIPKSQVKKLVEELQLLGFDEELIKKMLPGKLWLLQQTEPTLTLCCLLLDHGSTPHLICKVVERIPQMHQRDIRMVPDVVNEVLFFFRNFGFTEKEIFSLLEKEASVLFMDIASTRNSIEMVKSYFPAALTKKVICASPNVLYDSWSSTHEKFNYCVFMMGYNQSDIVKSRLFSHTLNHIKDRHIFLMRAGVFQVVNKKLHPSLNVNPPLSNVVDSNIASFVKLVGGGVSVDDYRVFRNMRGVEREKEELLDNDDDDDDYLENSGSSDIESESFEETQRGAWNPKHGCDKLKNKNKKRFKKK